MTQQEMLGQFSDLWCRLGAKGPAGLYFAWLESQYSKPFRFHHTLEKHIAPMLDEFSEVSNLVESPEVVELAIWYHDVYDPRRRDHEQMSAVLAYEVCQSAGLQQPAAEKIRRIIEARRSNAQDLESRFMLDCDYAILGRPSEEFERYDEDIRKEFSLLIPVANWPRFEERRREFLEGLRNRVFLTPYFIDKYEPQARKNIEWAIKRTYTSLPGREAAREKRLPRQLLPHLHPYYDPAFDENSGPAEPLRGLGLFDHWFEFEPEEKDERPGGRSGMFDHWFEFD